MVRRASTFFTSFRSGLSRRQFIPLNTESLDTGGHNQGLSVSLLGKMRVFKVRGLEASKCIGVGFLVFLALAFFIWPIIELPVAGIPFILRNDPSPFKPSRIQANWSEGFLTGNGIKIRYLQTVQSTESEIAQKPKLVFLHGLTASAGTLIPLFNDLSDDFHIFLPDARGHGGTHPIPAKSFSMDNLVADAIAAVKFFAGDEKVFLGGHSMGASTAARVAKSAPELFRAAVLEDPPWLRMPGEKVEQPYRGLPPMFEDSRKLHKLSPKDLSALSAKAAGLPPFVEVFADSLREFDADIIAPTFIHTDDVINEAVPDIVVPTLLQTGGYFAVCRPRVARLILKTWTAGSTYNFKGAGHLLHIDPHREEWLENVRSFYKRHMS